MRKVIAAMNMTLDGVCDHTVGIVDEELHQHYSDLIHSAGVILYGRITYQLMQYWQTLLINPSGEKSMDDFAEAIGQVHKIVFSTTLENTGWDSAELATEDLAKKVIELKQQSGKDILVGSRSLIVQLLNLKLVDELQICIHPIVEGKGLRLFDKIKDSTVFRLLKTKTLGSGVIVIYYDTKGG